MLVNKELNYDRQEKGKKALGGNIDWLYLFLLCIWSEVSEAAEWP